MASTHPLRRVLAVAVAVLVCGALASAQKGPSPAAPQKGTSPPAPPAPTLVVLPELRGTVNSQPSDINDANYIVGTMWDSANIGTAVVWIPNGTGWQIQVIGKGLHPAGPFPRAINNSNEILLNRTVSGNSVASVYSLANKSTVVLPIPAGLDGDVTSARGGAIANNGMILGGVSTPPDPSTGQISKYQPVVWVRDGLGWIAVKLATNCYSSDSSVTCDYLSISKSIAADGHGWIAGNMSRAASNGQWGWAASAPVYQTGVMGEFQPLGSDSSILSKPAVPPLSGANMINKAGMSAGYYMNCSPDSPPCVSQAAFWSAPSAMTLLPTYQAFPNQVAARANGINDSGDVVGWATFVKSGTQEKAAAYWKLNASAAVKLGVSKPYQTAEAVAINNSRLIIGTARESTGRPRAVAWKLN